MTLFNPKNAKERNEIFYDFSNNTILAAEFRKKFSSIFEQNLNTFELVGLKEFYDKGSLGFILSQIAEACQSLSDKNLLSFIKDVLPLFNQACKNMENLEMES